MAQHPKKSRCANIIPPPMWNRFNFGLSLVELQVAMVIFGGIALLIGSVYFMQTKLFNEERINIQVASENKNAIDELANQVRASTSVITGCTTCGGDTDSSSTILILQLWPLDANSNPVDPMGTNYDFVVYKKNGTNLVKNIFPHATSTRLTLSAKIISSYVKTLAFAYNNASPQQATEVTVTLTNEAKSFVKTHTYSQSAKAVLRNK